MYLILLGWLLMKRDLINSWRSRYFIIYQDRLEYYTDQNDMKTQKVISLIGRNFHLFCICSCNFNNYCRRQNP